MAVIYHKKLRGWRFVLFNICLGLGHAVVLFNAGAYIAMLPRVAGGLGIPPSFATWTQTDYMIGLALAFPVGIWASRRIGSPCSRWHRRPVPIAAHCTAIWRRASYWGLPEA